MKTANKGEWSEFYVFLKLLGDGGLYAADADLNKIEKLYYPLIKILRQENSSKKEYLNNSPKIKVIDGESKECLLELPAEEFKVKASLLLNAIKQSNKTFEVPEIEQFMNLIYCSKISADSADKSDINIVLHDKDTFCDTKFGFSIKSRLGSSSTLLNAGKTTNFIYEIVGDLSASDVNKINEISTKSKIRDRINGLIVQSCSLHFIKTENNNFNSNLQVIDTALPTIISDILLLYYQGQGSSIIELTEKINLINPCNYDLTGKHSFYEYKMKKLLSDTALGMKPASAWSGQIDATGGYIIVREDGEILCYHLYNKNEFEYYLFKNTKLDTPSTTKYDFGTIYSNNNRNYIKLNLQVRFY